jgi:hypothetical protein
MVAHILPLLLLVTAFAALFEHHRTGHWWSLAYFASLLVPFTVIIVFVWFALVPRSIELDDDELSIVRWWDSDSYVSIPLGDLQYYMQGSTTFMIQRTGESAYQVYPGAFRSDSWDAFIHALETRFPERKASYYIGATLHGRKNT